MIKKHKGFIIHQEQGIFIASRNGKRIMCCNTEKECIDAINAAIMASIIDHNSNQLRELK